MGPISFQWEASKETADLLKAVGLVTVTWARVDECISRALVPFWIERRPPTESMPRDAKRRIQYLADFASPLYELEPQECRVFKWFIYRLKEANSFRNDVAHGVNGRITVGQKTCEGLRIPFPSSPDRYILKKIKHIEHLGKTLQTLEGELMIVAAALWQVLVASSPDKESWQDRDGQWTRITMANRNPMLPQWIPPPPTFLG